MGTANNTISSEGPLLGLAEESTLWEKRDEAPVKAELTRRYMEVARGAALSFRKSSEPFEDLLQVANLALVMAIDRFDPSRGVPFRSFAAPTINGELKRHFRDRVGQVRLPRSLHERISRVDSVVSDLSADLRRDPEISEIADEIDSGEEEVVEAIEAKQRRFTVSMEAPVDGGPDGATPADRIGTEDEHFEEVEDSITLGSATDELSGPEKQVLRLRFREDLTQSEIADEIGCSQMHVSRILRRSIETLRNELSEQAA
jgi:RNA polymerase sigma-B factor